MQNERWFGRMNAIRKMQKYAIIKDNIDGHCSNACLKSVRTFGIEHKKHAMFMPWDDKNRMKFGAPGEPLAQSNKTRRKNVAKDLQFLASDHDMCIKTHAMPSLIGKAMWDEDDSHALGKCYAMDVTIVLKEAEVCPSNSFQHAAELIMNFENCEEEHMMLQADGGHDHDCSNPRNITSFLMIMNELKMQHLIAMKNAGFFFNL